MMNLLEQLQGRSGEEPLLITRGAVGTDDRSERGFTLLELIIVIVLIGILTSVALPVFGNIQENARHSATEAAASNGASSARTALFKDPFADLSEPLNTMNEQSDDIAVSVAKHEGGVDGICVEAVWLDDNSISARAGNACEGQGEDFEPVDPIDPNPENTEPPITPPGDETTPPVDDGGLVPEDDETTPPEDDGDEGSEDDDTPAGSVPDVPADEEEEVEMVDFTVRYDHQVLLLSSSEDREVRTVLTRGDEVLQENIGVLEAGHHSKRFNAPISEDIPAAEFQHEVIHDVQMSVYVDGEQVGSYWFRAEDAIPHPNMTPTTTHWVYDGDLLFDHVGEHSFEGWTDRDADGAGAGDAVVAGGMGE